MHPHCLFVVNELLALNCICLSCLRVADPHEIRYVADMIEVAENTDESLFAHGNVYQLIKHTAFYTVGNVSLPFQPWARTPCSPYSSHQPWRTVFEVIGADLCVDGLSLDGVFTKTAQRVQQNCFSDVCLYVIESLPQLNLM